MTDSVKVSIDNSIATITLNRPDVHNAFDEEMIKSLIGTLEGLVEDWQPRAVVLRGSGKSFCAGGDLNWMRRTADYKFLDNVEDAMGLAKLLKTLNNYPRPTIALVQGAAYGGGVGLAACCDIVVASDKAKFCLSEVKIGLVPSVIAPYVISKIGESAARRYFLTAEVMPAALAENLGLVHEIVSEKKLDAKCEELLEVLAQGAPEAQGAGKALIAAVGKRPIDEDVIRETAERIAEARASETGKAGIQAFLNKETPPWRA